MAALAGRAVHTCSELGSSLPSITPQAGSEAQQVPRTPLWQRSP